MRYLKQLFLISGFSLFSGWVQAQQHEFTLYYLDDVYQSSFLNAAAAPEYGTSLTLPGFGPFYMGLENSGFNVKNGIKDETIQVSSIIDKLKKRNMVSAGAGLDLFALRVKSKDYFFSFNARTIADLRFVYPKDLLEYFWQGNTSFEGESADFSKTNINASLYHELALGFYREKDGAKWSYGGRIKVLLGVANTSSNNKKTTINTSDDTFETDVEVDAQLNTSGLTIFDNGSNSSKEIFQQLTSFKNMGLGLDLGGRYQLTNKIKLAGSIRDLGFI